LDGRKIVRIHRVQIPHRRFYAAMTHELRHHLYRNSRLNKTGSENTAKIINPEGGAALPFCQAPRAIPPLSPRRRTSGAHLATPDSPSRFWRAAPQFGAGVVPLSSSTSRIGFSCITPLFPPSINHVANDNEECSKPVELSECSFHSIASPFSISALRASAWASFDQRRGVEWKVAFA